MPTLNSKDWKQLMQRMKTRRPNKKEIEKGRTAYYKFGFDKL